MILYAVAKWWPQIQAFRNGGLIEERWVGPKAEDRPWKETSDPAFSADRDYECRIKPAPEKWAEERKAFAEGKKIEYRYPFAHDKNDPTPATMSAWFPISHPEFDSTPSMEFRIAPDQPDRWSSVREAQARGEKVQMRVRYLSHSPWGKWQPWTYEIDATHAADLNLEFRVAPPKRYRPFTAEEVVLGKEVVSRTGYRALVIAVSPKRVRVAKEGLSLADFLKNYTFTDGTPCGVEVEEDGQ